MKIFSDSVSKAVNKVTHVALISTLVVVGGLGAYRMWNGEADPLHWQIFGSGEASAGTLATERVVEPERRDPPRWSLWAGDGKGAMERSIATARQEPDRHVAARLRPQSNECAACHSRVLPRRVEEARSYPRASCRSCVSPACRVYLGCD